MAQRNGVRSLVEQTVFLDQLFDRMDELEEAELTLNQRISDLQKDLSDLQISMNRLTPLEIATKLDLFQEKIFSCPKPSTALLQNNLSILKDRFEHLHFKFVFPDTEELNPDSFQNNLLYRIEQKIFDSADPEAAAKLRRGLSGLQLQCEAAEEIFHGRGLGGYFKLSEEIHQDVEGRLFERFPDQTFDSLSTQPEGQIQIAAAIMASLSDRMMSPDL